MGYHDKVPGADGGATINSYVRDVVGNKSDASSVAAGASVYAMLKWAVTNITDDWDRTQTPVSLSDTTWALEPKNDGDGIRLKDSLGTGFIDIFSAQLDGATSLQITNDASERIVQIARGSEPNILIGPGVFGDAEPHASGINNVVIGQDAVTATNLISFITAVGIGALENATGNANNAFGFNAGRFCVAGADNTFQGNGSGPTVVSGNYGVYIGNSSGSFASGDSSYMTCIGNGCGTFANATNADYGILIGASAATGMTLWDNVVIIDNGQGALPYFEGTMQPTTTFGARYNFDTLTSGIGLNVYADFDVGTTFVPFKVSVDEGGVERNIFSVAKNTDMEVQIGGNGHAEHGTLLRTANTFIMDSGAGATGLQLKHSGNLVLWSGSTSTILYAGGMQVAAFTAGTITMTPTSAVSYLYGGSTTGDDLQLFGNTAEARSNILIKGNGGVAIDIDTANNFDVNEMSVNVLRVNPAGSTYTTDATTGVGWKFTDTAGAPISTGEYVSIDAATNGGLTGAGGYGLVVVVDSDTMHTSANAIGVIGGSGSNKDWFMVRKHAVNTEGPQIILDGDGAFGTAALPTLAFGNGDTGFGELADGQMVVSVEGSACWQWNGGKFMAWEPDGPGMNNVVVSATVPGLLPHKNDGDTGIGRAAADQLSLIAGGVEGLRLIEDTGVIPIWSVTATITASTTQTQGQQPLKDHINEIAVVANANDTVTLPSAIAGMKVVVINNGANTLKIYPASGDNLGTGVDASDTLATGDNVTYAAYDATNWEAI